MKAIKCKNMKDIAKDGVSFTDARIYSQEEGESKQIILLIKFLLKEDVDEILNEANKETVTIEDAVNLSKIGEFKLTLTALTGIVNVNNHEDINLSKVSIPDFTLIHGMIENFRLFMLEIGQVEMISSIESILKLIENIGTVRMMSSLVDKFSDDELIDNEIN